MARAISELDVLFNLPTTTSGGQYERYIIKTGIPTGTIFRVEFIGVTTQFADASYDYWGLYDGSGPAKGILGRMYLTSQLRLGTPEVPIRTEPADFEDFLGVFLKAFSPPVPSNPANQYLRLKGTILADREIGEKPLKPGAIERTVRSVLGARRLVTG